MSQLLVKLKAHSLFSMMVGLWTFGATDRKMENVADRHDSSFANIPSTRNTNVLVFTTVSVYGSCKAQ